MEFQFLAVLPQTLFGAKKNEMDLILMRSIKMLSAKLCYSIDNTINIYTADTYTQ